MRIRRAKKEDGSSIKDIDSSIECDPNRETLINESLIRGTVWIATDGASILGYSIVNRSFFHRPALEMLMIDKEYRRQGVGRTLLRDALIRLSENEELWTSTNESNTAMRLLLESEGFKKTGWVDNLDPGDPELICFKGC